MKLSEMIVIQNSKKKEKYIIYGSLMGDLHAVRYESLL